MPNPAPLIAMGILALLAVFLGTDDKKAQAAPRKRDDEVSPDDAAALLPADDSAASTPAVDMPAPTEADKTFSPEVQEKIDKAEVTHDPTPLKEAAEIAKSEGKDAQAVALEKAYDGARVESGTVTFVSPIANVKPEFWTKFVNCVKGDNPKLITLGFALGLFGFGARRLVDLGIMTNPRMGTYKGKSVWTGTWVAPLDINKFLADSALQYKVFFASMRDYASKVRDTPGVKALIGKSVDGKTITLSGILGVAHRAGWSGMTKWFTVPADRAKFTATTEAFRRCNGIF